MFCLNQIFQKGTGSLPTIVYQYDTNIPMVVMKLTNTMWACCIGWESPTRGFQWRFWTMAGLVGKEAVFEKRH